MGPAAVSSHSSSDVKRVKQGGERGRRVFGKRTDSGPARVATCRVMLASHVALLLALVDWSLSKADSLQDALRKLLPDALALVFVIDDAALSVAPFAVLKECLRAELKYVTVAVIFKLPVEDSGALRGRPQMTTFRTLVLQL